MSADVLRVEINKIKGIDSLKINMPLTPDVYAITGVNGIGKSTVLTAISPRLIENINFSLLKPFDYTMDSFISFSINENTEIWKPDPSGDWHCTPEKNIKIAWFPGRKHYKGNTFFQFIFL